MAASTRQRRHGSARGRPRQNKPGGRAPPQEGRLGMRSVLRTALLALALGVAGGAASGQETIKIGVLLPLSGNAASAGQQSKAAIELAAEIVNNAHPEMANLPLAAGAGVPR